MKSLNKIKVINFRYSGTVLVGRAGQIEGVGGKDGVAIVSR
jgi:hypothetical protein